MQMRCHALPCKIEEAQTRNVAQEYIRIVANTGVPQAMTIEQIEEEASVDEELEYVRQSIETGNWENPNCANYKSIRVELCRFGKNVLRGIKLLYQRSYEQE